MGKVYPDQWLHEGQKGQLLCQEKEKKKIRNRAMNETQNKLLGLSPIRGRDRKPWSIEGSAAATSVSAERGFGAVGRRKTQDATNQVAAPQAKTRSPLTPA